MKCPRCQHENLLTMKFCSECGASLRRAPPGAGSATALQVEVEILRHSLSEALEQQTATAEILRVISSSPTYVQPVFEAIAQAHGTMSVVSRYDGELIHLAAHAHVSA